MKSVLSSIDLICVTRELGVLAGAFVKKIYQVGDEIVFHLFKEGTKYVLRIVIGKLVHLTNFVKENPAFPSGFCMFLRKYLMGARIVSVSQPRLERVVVIRFSHGDEFLKLFVELFSSGNAVITDDVDVIKSALSIVRFSARVIKHGEVYSLPPSSFDLSSPDLVSFTRLVKSSSKADLVRFLATEVGLGGAYAEEICLLANVDKSSNPNGVSDEVITLCFNAINELIKKAKYIELSPRVILDGSKIVDVIPFPIRFYESKKFKSYSSFNEALDFFYAESSKESSDSLREKVLSEKRSKILKRLNEQKAYVSELNSESALIKARALELKNNLFLVERVVSSLLSAKRNGYSWDDIILMVEREASAGSPEANVVKSISPSDNLIVLNLADGISMPLNADVRVFMDDLFNESKKLESKIDGAMQAVTRTEAELAELDAKGVEVKVNLPKSVDSSGKEWFEKFKWTRTSEGYLVIAGRDAQQNELIIRKYLEPDDLVFHADIHGSPFTILRNGRKAGSVSRDEAASFTAAHSSAWSKGVSVDVYFVLPFQVSKDAPSGEYLTTGGFMIRGKKEFIKSVKLELCLGVEVVGDFSYRLLSGPKSVVSKVCKVFVTLEPGSKPESEVVKQIIDFFKSKDYSFTYELVRAALPSGGYRII